VVPRCISYIKSRRVGRIDSSVNEKEPDLIVRLMTVASHSEEMTMLEPEYGLRYATEWEWQRGGF
jgi:hypothetical protein